MINSQALQNKLAALKISGAVIKTENNSFYDCYHVLFNDDITLNKIRARRDDIALFMGGPVDIETDTETGAVVLKVLKKDRDGIAYTPFFNDLKDARDGSELPLIIGETENGTRLLYDLAKMPHLLAAGSTGSGKSVFMHNCILSTIASGAAPVLIDVKRVEFSYYDNLPCLAAPVVYTAHDALDVLKRLTAVMDKRYITLKENNARNIKEYTDRGGDMQYIVVFIDELADLIMINSKIESYIIRLAQLGRAAGIHLVLSTQRPDSTIISGLIRVNIPSRVCFAVQKATDSRIILDMSGGETLRGAGDGLFLPIGSKTPVRFQAPFIPTEDLIQIIDNIRKKCI